VNMLDNVTQLPTSGEHANVKK